MNANKKSKNFVALGQELFTYAALLKSDLGIIFSDNEEFLKTILAMDLSEFIERKDKES